MIYTFYIHYVYIYIYIYTFVYVYTFIICIYNIIYIYIYYQDASINLPSVFQEILTEEMEPAEVARRALRQGAPLSFLAQLLRENLGEVLQGMPLFPVMKGCLSLGNQWKLMKGGLHVYIYIYIYTCISTCLAMILDPDNLNTFSTWSDIQ